MKKEKNQLVSATTQLKLAAADEKKYKTDMLDSNGVIELSKNSPNNKATKSSPSLRGRHDREVSKYFSGDSSLRSE